MDWPRCSYYEFVDGKILVQPEGCTLKVSPRVLFEERILEEWRSRTSAQTGYRPSRSGGPSWPRLETE